MSVAQTEQEITYHPLFPSDEDDDYPDISWINVCRYESTGKVWYPYLFPASELQDLTFIQERFGGGRYELLARDIQKRGITARRDYQIPGAPKPMIETTKAEADMHAKAAQTQQAPPIQQQHTSEPMAMMMQMMMQMMMAQQQSQTQMMLAFMNGSGDRSKEYVNSMQSLHDRHAQANNAANERILTLITTMNQGGGGRGSGEDFYKGVEFMREFAKAQVEMAKAGQSDGDSGDKFLDTILEALQGFQAFKDLQNTANGVGNAPPNPGN